MHFVRASAWDLFYEFFVSNSDEVFISVLEKFEIFYFNVFCFQYLFLFKLLREVRAIENFIYIIPMVPHIFFPPVFDEWQKLKAIFVMNGFS